MAKTLTQLSTDVLDEIGEDSTDAALLALCAKWVQRVYDEIGNELDWRFNYILDTITTVDGTRTYDLNVNVRDVSSARIQTSGEVLGYRSKDSLFNGGYDMENKDTPYFYYFDEFNPATNTGKIGFFPIPGSVKLIDLNCQGRSATLVAGDDIPVPTDFLTLIHEGTLALAHRHEREWEAFDKVYGMYIAHKLNLKKVYMHPNGQVNVMQPTDIPRSGGMSPVRFPPGRFRNF